MTFAPGAIASASSATGGAPIQKEKVVAALAAAEAAFIGSFSGSRDYGLMSCCKRRLVIEHRLVEGIDPNV